jgi:hypothetical protein
MFSNISNNEQAESIDFHPLWEPGSPNPYLLQSDNKAFLVYKIKNEPHKFAIVEWVQCRGAVLGGLNDEAISGHRLWNKGLKDCLFAAEVKHSSWIEELRKENSVHPYHDDEMFSSLRHYILLLKDSTFECIAAPYIIEVVEKSQEEVLNLVVAQLGD